MSACSSRRRVAPPRGCECVDDDGLMLSDELDTILCGGERVTSCQVPTTAGGLDATQVVNAALCVAGVVAGNPAACAATLRDLLSSRGF